MGGTRGVPKTRKTGKYSTRRELTIAVHFYRKEGMIYADIANKVGVSECTVQRIMTGDPITSAPKEKKEPVARSGIDRLNNLWHVPATT